MISRRNIEFVIYLAGMMLFGLFYYPLKAAIGSPWLFVVVALTWVATLRLAGAFVRRTWFRDAGSDRKDWSNADNRE